MTNAEIIKALRYCISDNADDCDLCPYQSDCKRNGTGKDKMMRDAADALEAAEKRIAELEAQMPKQGKWISDLPNGFFENVNHWKCSVCGKRYHFREDYCPYCGARMTKGEEK